MLVPTTKLLIQTILIAFSVFYASRSEKPVITQRPHSQNVYVNKSATFICRAQSAIPFEREWKKDDSGQLLRSVPGFLLIANESLTFLNARRSDAGIYTCIVRNSDGTSSAQAGLSVLDPPVKPTITGISANQTVAEGERVTFTCEATGNPLPQINWKIFLESGHDNDPQLERPSPRSIRISSVTPRNAGRYTCIAENDSGNDTEAIYLIVLGYPVFLISPRSIIEVHENSTVTSDCKVIGSPSPDVRWYYDDKPAVEISNVVVLDNNTLRISDVKFANSGRYTCMANNSAGLRRSKNTLLRVFKRPKLDCCPDKSTAWQNQTAIKGKSMSLDCSAAGYPKPSYRWAFENKMISSSPVFTISSVSRSDEGVFSCTANNTYGEVKLMIYLNVLVPPNVSVQPEQAIAAAGESVTFSCTATGVPLPSVTWYSSSKGLLSHNNTLAIANVSKNDQEDFLCEARNDAGGKRVHASLVVAVQPKFLISPRNISVNETSTVNIQCSAKGPDLPRVSWYRLISNGEKMKLNHSGNVFTITNIVRSDTGFYVCQATNHAGYINATFFINVQYPPYALTSDDMSVVAGEEAVMRCPINANPVAEVEWLTPLSFEGARLILAKVDISHAGQYSCRGRNILGVVEAVVQLLVMSPPRIVDLKLVELLNNLVTISCVTNGTPKPDVNWFDLSSSPVSFNVYDGQLLINKHHINRMKFVCNASNVYGWMVKYVAVPSSPYNFTVTKISSNSVRFSWLTNESKVVNNFTIERRPASELDWTTVTTIVSPWFEDENLPPFTKFMYRVSARNALGMSEHSESLNVTTKEGVPSPPSKLEARSITLTSITVYWEPPRKPRGRLGSIVYEIFYEESAGLFKNETVNNMRDNIKLPKLMSATLYLVMIRAGRQVDGTLRWSDYRSISTRTLQKAPQNPPKEIEAVSNGPRRIYVTWEIHPTYVEGYKVQYKEYESTNHSIVVIKSWNASSYMITGLTASQYYEIQLNMFTTGGDGPWSRPIVVHTETDRFGLPGPVSSNSDSLPWKIAVGGSVLGVILLLVILVYIYLTRKSKNTESADTKGKKKKSRNNGGYDFTDNMSTVSNESEGSTKGVYNVNIMNDHIDLSMFDNSHHSNVVPGHMYVENPILPSSQDDSDDSYEAVRLATFIARSSPQSTPYLTGRRQLSASHVNPAYFPDEDDDVYRNVNDATTSKNEEPDEDSDIPVYSQVDFAKKERDRESRHNNALEQLSDDVLI